jgi:hypothetical protein
MKPTLMQPYHSVLIGSKAAREFFPDFRKSKDRDYLIDADVKGHKDWPEGRVEFYNCNQGRGYRWLFDKYDYTVGPEGLYALKLAHSFWDIHWHKTMADILFFQEHNVNHLGCLVDLLYQDNLKIHGDKKAKLKKKNDDFFKDHVQRTYVHDDLHKAMAYYDEPLYQKVKHDRSKAFIDHDLFLNLSYEDQLRLCREEIYVTALERFCIPRNFQVSRLVAYRGACRLLVTSMTKGWFPKFIVFNWKELCRPDDYDFINIFKEKEHEIRRVEEDH